jgi:hypothetical protein
VNLIGFLIFIVSGFEFLPIHGEDGWMSMTDLGELVLSNSSDVKLAWIGGLMIWISAILFMFLMGSLLLFRIKNKWVKFVLASLVVTGIIGIVICAVVGMRTGRDFAYEGEIEMELKERVDKKELVIVARQNGYKNFNDYQVKGHGHLLNLQIEKDIIKSYGIDIEYIPTSDTTFKVRQNITAQGKSHPNAVEKCKHIYHDMEIINDTLYVDLEYSYPKTDKLRAQNVAVIIEIPEGYSVRYKNRVIHLGAADEDDVNDHPYYKKQGRIRGDGSYDHYSEGKSRRNRGNDLEREIKDEILEELRD